MKKKCHIKVFRNCLLIGLLSLLVFACGDDPAEEADGVLVPDHIGKARVFYHQGDYRSAAEMYHKALELDPDNADTYLQLGIIYDDNLKDEEQAVYYYNQFLIREPDSDKAKRVRGWVEKSTEMIEEGNGHEESEPIPARSSRPGPIRPSVPLLPTPAEVAPPDSAPEATPEELASAETRYTVKSGDTLAGIAKKFYGDLTAWKRIYQANRDKLANPNALKVGQELTIPGGRQRAVIDI
jgi:LysM repeat protein